MWSKMADVYLDGTPSRMSWTENRHVPDCLQTEWETFYLLSRRPRRRHFDPAGTLVRFTTVLFGSKASA